jgi:transcriptional regulator of arginine metabolism
LSRDLRDLAIVKTPGGYARSEASTPESHAGRRDERLNRALREFVHSVETAGTLVVLKTPPSAAHPVAYALDEADLPEAVGTIAGDDTIFVATRSAALAGKLSRRLLAPLRPAVSVPARRPRA